MGRILIFYYSRTGNTEKMATAVSEGARALPNMEVELTYHVSPENLTSYDAILIGCPTYHHDMAIGVKNLFEEAAEKNISLKNKVGAAFGSFGWSGEAPRLVNEIMKNKFEMDVIEPPLIIKYKPSPAGLERCRKFGKNIAERLMAQG